MYIASVENLVDRFHKIAVSQDLFVYTYVPKQAINYIREKGILSASELIKDKKALRLARPNNYKKFVQDTKERQEDPDWKEIVDGVSAFFTLPDYYKISDKHNIFKYDLVPIRINLSKFMKDYPDTKLLGVELEPYNSKKETQPNRERKISLQEAKNYIQDDPKSLWKHYDNPKDKLYAPNVPHVIIITKMKKIPSKYVVS